MLMENKMGKVKSALSIVLYFAFVILVWYYVSTFLVDKEAVRNVVSRYGIFSPIAFILVQISQNIIAPIAHYPINLAGGFIFGSIYGFFLNWLGTSIGTFLIILLSRKYGRPLVNRMVSKRIIEKYDHIVQKLSPFGLFLLYGLPIFPDDEISYLIGVSSMPVKSIIPAIILGKIGGATFAFVGDDPIHGLFTSNVVGVVVLVIGSLFYLRKNIKNLFIKKKKFNSE